MAEEERRRSGGGRRSSDRQGFPRPPINNMTDFVVFSFVSIVVVMLVGGVTAFIVLSFKDPDRDMSRGIAIFSDITTSLISALVGFLAGKGSGAADAKEAEIQRMKTDQQPPPPPPTP